jgi:hypothetical protein
VNTRILLHVGLFAVLAIATGAKAEEIYRWVDADGVVHYADARPEAAPSPVETLYIPDTNPPGYDPAAARREIVAEAERIRAELAALRQARAEQRAPADALAAEAEIAELERRLAAAEEAAYATRAVYRPFAFAHPHHRRFHPGMRHLPERRPPPRREPDPGPRPGWPGPGE